MYQRLFVEVLPDYGADGLALKTLYCVEVYEFVSQKRVHMIFDVLLPDLGREIENALTWARAHAAEVFYE